MIANRDRIGYGVAAATAVTLLLACGGDGGGGNAGAGERDGGGTLPQSILSSMLPEGETRFQLPVQELTLDEIGFDFGTWEAPIKVVEFSDFGCGYCRRFHTETFPSLMKDYIETGRMQWKYVTYVSGMFPNGKAAALAGECAGEQELFEPMSALLYERQSEWKGVSNPAAVLEALAVETGADGEQFRACIAEERPLARIRSGLLTGARVGVRGTPTFVINGIPLVGAQPLSMWADIVTAIESGVAAAAKGSAPGGAGSSPPPRP